MSKIGSEKKVLLTAFQGTSAEWLLDDVTDCETLFLPNNKEMDSKLLIEAISKEAFDYVISLGQRPNIKDKLHIETTARDGETCIHTDFECERLKELFEKKGIVTKISHNAGTSYCNRLYWSGLQYIMQNELDVKMVFVHIPFKKNIADIDQFKRAILEVISAVRKGL